MPGLQDDLDATVGLVPEHLISPSYPCVASLANPKEIVIDG